MNEIETFYGLVENTLDALRIFQMCQEGRLNRVRRRLHERERRLIRSGSVFVFDEEESGIRRWTDGRLWSPSRILGNFLIYRELERKGSRVSKSGNYPVLRKRIKLDSSSDDSFTFPTPILPKTAPESNGLWSVPKNEQSEDMKAIQEWLLQDNHGINPKELQSNDPDKSIDSGKEKSQRANPISGESLRVLKSKKLSNNHKGRYVFKENGLIKKTISIQLDGHTHHLVAYYSLEDFCKGHLKLNRILQTNEEGHEELSDDKEQVPFEPHLMEMLRQMPIPVELMIKQNFRKPASYLAAATADAQGILSANPENGEKLITALEYGAINPSDLQAAGGNRSGDQREKAGTSNFVPGGGIIFSSSSFSLQDPVETVYNPRPRRHSSFHPSIIPVVSDSSSSLDIMDESSRLSGEALEFLSQYSPDTDSDDLLQSVSTNVNADELSPLPAIQTLQAGSLETELFGSILECCKESTEENCSDLDEIAEIGKSMPNQNRALRGEDLLLTEFNV